MATDAFNKDAAYAGMWLALVGDQVAGVGQTPDAALHLAHANRPKDKLRLHYVDPLAGEPLTLPPLLDTLRPFLTHQPQPVYLVGGAVRDALLGRPSYDLDFVVPQDAIKLTFQLANEIKQPAYALDRERDTGRIVLADTVLDLARFRAADLEGDLRARDFTINAMALPANATTTASLIDPTGGLADLRAGIVRQTHDQAIANDPIRALRALRISHRLGFAIEDETATAVSQAKHNLSTISAERVRDELLKLLQVDPAAALTDLHRYGLLPVTLPEMVALDGLAQSPPHHEPVLDHTVSVLRWLVAVETAVVYQKPVTEPALQQAQTALSAYAASLSDHLHRAADGSVDGRTLLLMGALLHDVGKADTRTTAADGRFRFFGHDKVGAKIAARRLSKLAMSNKASDHVRRIVLGHMRPLLLANSKSPVTRRAVYRFFRDVGDAGLDIGLLTLADHLATFNGPGNREDWQRLLTLVGDLYRHYFDHHAETVAPVALLKGKALMKALDLPPGPEVGRLLRLLEEAQASGEVHTKDEALAFVQKLVQKKRP